MEKFLSAAIPVAYSLSLCELKLVGTCCVLCHIRNRVSRLTKIVFFCLVSIVSGNWHLLFLVLYNSIRYSTENVVHVIVLTCH